MDKHTLLRYHKETESGDLMTEKMKIIDFLRENQLDAIFVQRMKTADI